MIHATNSTRVVVCVIASAPENAQVAEEGLEGGPFSMVKAPLFHHDGAKSGAVPDDLLWIIEAWPKLNESTKADMIAMVRAE